MREAEAIITLTELANKMERLRDIMDRYDVARIEEIETSIKGGKIPEHPSYEDYLSALTLKNEIDNLRSKLLREIEGLEIA